MKIIIFLQKLSARPKGTLIPEQARLPVAFQSEAGKELSFFPYFNCVESRLHLNKESNKSRRFLYFCKNSPLGPKGRFRKEMKKELSTFGAASAKRSDGVARAEPNLFKLCRVTTEFEELKLLHLCRVVTKVMERSYITLNFFATLTALKVGCISTIKTKRHDFVLYCLRFALPLHSENGWRVQNKPFHSPLCPLNP